MERDKIIKYISSTKKIKNPEYVFNTLTTKQVKNLTKYIERREEEEKKEKGRPEDVLNEFKLISETPKKNKL